MDEELKATGPILGALGLSEVTGILLVAPKYGLKMSIVVGLAILLLFVLIFGGYYLYRRMRARRRREVFTAAIEAQTNIAPRSLSDPNQRAALDKLRQKFQIGLQEYKSRDKNIYDLPWYVIIGEPGSGKTEAIRHSGVDFPPGLQNELQGSGGTVNMDWWFTNHGIILDTAGRMLFDESPAGQTPEWNEFLRLLKKARSHCPINGLFIVLSVESLIKDSADKIAQKASRLAQQLDLIQRTLDVRFPVFLLVTKCDLLTGFRDFFESIDDPLLQHQMFGWSNPDPLDSRFRPDLVDAHLRSVSERLRRRRLALLRESATRRLDDTGKFVRSAFPLDPTLAGGRRVEDVEALYALPESIMRLAPRLRRYLETIFVAGEWSAKPVFLRGIYFTSSMREGKALDEAIAFATGLPLDQLPEDQSWEKDRAFFLRDLFLEKVFRERGLVTRATNTLKMIRSRRVKLIVSLAGALLVFLGFAAFGFSSLKQSVLREADNWRVGATNLNQGAWAHPIVSVSQEKPFLFNYEGASPIDGRQSLVEYHASLKQVVDKDFHVGLVFKPISLLFPRGVAKRNRGEAQRILFETSVLNPLVRQTQVKLERTTPLPKDTAAVARHRQALLELMQLEADGLVSGPGRGYLSDASQAERYLKAFLSYLTETDWKPDTNLVDVLAWTYAKEGSPHGAGWPPAHLLGGASLSANKPLANGLTNQFLAMLDAQTNLNQQATALNQFVDSLREYHQAEQAWLSGAVDLCPLSQSLLSAKAKLDAGWTATRAYPKFASAPLTNLNSQYLGLMREASNTSASALVAPVGLIINRLNDPRKARGLFQEIQQLLANFVSQAAGSVRSAYDGRSRALPVLDQEQLTLVKSRVGERPQPAFETRWNLYTQACAVALAPIDLSTNDIGTQWKKWSDWRVRVAQFETNWSGYAGPGAELATNLCRRVATTADQSKKAKVVSDYLKLVAPKLAELTNGVWDLGDVARARDLLTRIENDLDPEKVGILGDEAQRLPILRQAMDRSRRSVLEEVERFYRDKVAFPVRAEAPAVMDANGLIQSRQLLEELTKQLTNSVWNAGAAADEAARIRKRLANYENVMTCLVTREGSVVPFELSVPPWDNLPDANDKNVVAALRYVRISDGQSEARDDLTRPDKPVLAQFSCDRELTLSFRRDRESGEGVQQKLPPWWILRQIRDGRAVPSRDTPNKWQVRVPIKDPNSRPNLSGFAYFDVHLMSANPFPKKDDWPK